MVPDPSQFSSDTGHYSLHFQYGDTREGEDLIMKNRDQTKSLIPPTKKGHVMRIIKLFSKWKTKQIKKKGGYFKNVLDNSLVSILQYHSCRQNFVSALDPSLELA